MRRAFRMHISRGFDWNAVWMALVRCCQSCADVAASCKRTVIIAPRVCKVICSADSLLRLMERVKRPNFKANLDTGHLSAQRKNVVLALSKRSGRFAKIHLADNNPVNADHLAMGEGVIDWIEFFRVLTTMRSDGYLGLDLETSPTVVECCLKSVDRIQAIASDLRIKVDV